MRRTGLEHSPLAPRGPHSQPKHSGAVQTLLLGLLISLTSSVTVLSLANKVHTKFFKPRDVVMNERYGIVMCNVGSLLSNLQKKIFMYLQFSASVMKRVSRSPSRISQDAVSYRKIKGDSTSSVWALRPDSHQPYRRWIVMRQSSQPTHSSNLPKHDGCTARNSRARRISRLILVMFPETRFSYFEETSHRPLFRSPKSLKAREIKLRVC